MLMVVRLNYANGVRLTIMLMVCLIHIYIMNRRSQVFYWCDAHSQLHYNCEAHSHLSYNCEAQS